jgi:hypothetical protein
MLMGPVIDTEFFRAAATVLPTLFVAFALTSHFLDPERMRSVRIRFVLLSDRTGIVAAAAVVFGFVGAELLTLFTLATDTPTFGVFVIVTFFVLLLAWFVGLQALNPLLQAAAATAEQQAPDAQSGARAIARYRQLGHWIMFGSLALLLGGSIIVFARVSAG